MNTIGEHLKKARLQTGLTQKEVEAKLGLRELSLKDFETERLKISAEIAIKFSQLYRVSLEELLTGRYPKHTDDEQKEKLARVDGLFHKGEMEFMLMDPVIRAFLEEYPEKTLESSIFDVLTLGLSERQKKIVTLEFLKTIGSLMGIDYRITEDELDFFTRLSLKFELEDHNKVITRSLSVKYLPEVANFYQRPSLRHFLVWILFFVSKSDGIIDQPELDYIQESAEHLRIHKSHYLAIKKYFVRDIH